MFVLGIDPGQTGGLALVSYDETGAPDIWEAIPMPIVQVRTKKTIDAHAVAKFMEDDRADAGIVELVGAMPSQGSASGFQFGRMFGAAEMMIYEHATTQHYVTPTVWKAKLGLTNDKKASLDLATREFGPFAANRYWPLKKHDGVAEAALLTLYYRRHILT